MSFDQSRLLMRSITLTALIVGVIVNSFAPEHPVAVGLFVIAIALGLIDLIRFLWSVRSP